ncbi:glucose 1-dehydrogenase [Casimicrobium huifangae]|uniref:glucose 1-dehydrogenase n=1 Tax=Casimicrobium huifangae TaxID=2591109 RepID=UPI0037844BEC
MTTHPLFDLSGKSALITGSSQGIGLALAEALASAGAQVIINGRDAAKCERVAQQFAARGQRVSVRAFDVTDSAAVTANVDGIEQDIGPIDILVNNTGIQIRNAFAEFPLADFQRLIETNLGSAFAMSQAVVRHMIPRGCGKIINVCSVNAELGRANIVPYTASKGALKMMTKGMCVELAKHGIQVNGLGPGYFDTELTQALVQDAAFTAWLKQRTPAGRWGNVEELKGAIIFLAAPASDFVNGHILYVDGGMTASV